MERMDSAKMPPSSQTPPIARPLGAGDGVVGQLMSLARALDGSRCRRQLGLLAAAIVVVICANTAAQIMLNRWQGAFYEAIEQKHIPAFMTQLLVFAAIVAVLLVLVVSQTWLQAMINVRLREWLTHDLLDQWLVRKRVYMLSFAGEIGVNPDQRIQQDAQHLTELTTILAIGLVQSTLLLVSFVGVLWVLSGQVVFASAGTAPLRSRATWSGARSPIRWAARCSRGTSAARSFRSMPSATPAKPICASPSCGSTSTPRASCCTTARWTSAACSTSRSTAWWP